MKVMHFESNLPGTVIDIFHSLKFCDWGITADSGAGAMNSLRDHHAGALRDPLKFSFPVHLTDVSNSGAHLRAFTVRAGVGVEHVGTNVARAALKKKQRAGVPLCAGVCTEH